MLAAGAILFEETLFQDTRKGTSMVSELQKQVSSSSRQQLPPAALPPFSQLASPRKPPQPGQAAAAARRRLQELEVQLVAGLPARVRRAHQQQQQQRHSCCTLTLSHPPPNPSPLPTHPLPPPPPQGLVPGIKVDKGLHPLANANGENWCAGLDGLAERCASYYAQGARFCKWRSTVSIPSGPTTIAVRDCAYGLARYAAIAQNAGLVSGHPVNKASSREGALYRTREQSWVWQRGQAWPGLQPQRLLSGPC